MTIKEARLRTQTLALFFSLHTYASKIRGYVALDKDGLPSAEEMRMLSRYVEEINRHDGRKILRQMLNEIKVNHGRSYGCFSTVPACLFYGVKGNIRGSFY